VEPAVSKGVQPSFELIFGNIEFFFVCVLNASTVEVKFLLCRGI
jgi:hypothetical protein